MGVVRDRVVRLRVSADEKLLLEARATEAGFRVSEFVRRVALGQASVGEARVDAVAAASPRPVPSSPSAAPAEALEKPYRCGYGPTCSFKTTSPRAVCPIHGRTVVSL